jgi:hypothetical protein
MGPVPVESCSKNSPLTIRFPLLAVATWTTAGVAARGFRPGAGDSTRPSRGWTQGTAASLKPDTIGSMTAVPDPVPDPVDDELESLLAQPAVQARLTEFERRLQADELDLIPHSEVRRRIDGNEE